LNPAPRSAADCYVRIPVSRWPAPAAAPALDAVAEEQAVALSYNGVSHVVMMMTPADLEDFAVGFSLSEAIVDVHAEIREIEVLQRPLGLEVAVRLPSARDAALRERRRNLTGRTGCGLCGAESLEQVIRDVPRLPENLVIGAAAIDTAIAALAALQPLARETGGAHAAAWADEQGRILLVREDVGRHNALDKLIGALVCAGLDAARGFALVSSRASYEMVLKSARAGIQVLAAVSAPTSLAVRLAGEAGLTLVAFARPGRLSAYSRAGRIIDIGAESR
jgi:FdhD protein